MYVCDTGRPRLVGILRERCGSICPCMYCRPFFLACEVPPIVANGCFRRHPTDSSVHWCCRSANSVRRSSIGFEHHLGDPILAHCMPVLPSLSRCDDSETDSVEDCVQDFLSGENGSNVCPNLSVYDFPKI